MNCEQIQKLIHAHHDGELDVANMLLVDEHLADCPRCFAVTRQLSSLRGALQNEGLRFNAPASLRQSIGAAVQKQEASERESVFTRPWFGQLGWAAAAVFFLTSLVAFYGPTLRKDDPLLADLTAGHVRSLMVDHLMDVASADQHTVKPWFDGKLEFAPPVKDLKDVGFPLLGGRMDYVEGHQAAALVYGRQKHFINLFVWPASAPTVAGIRKSQRNGYNTVRWSDGRMTYGAVSDLNEKELTQFAQEWAAR